MFRTLVFVAGLMAVQAIAQADVYRWVDAQGRVQYSDRWVPGSELVKVDKSRQDPAAASTRQSTDRSKLAASNERIAEQQAQNANAQAVQKDVSKVRDEQCTQAKDRYEKAIVARRIFKQNPDGTKQYISDAEADAYRVKARSDMQLACGNSAR